MKTIYHIHDVLDYLYSHPEKKSEIELSAMIGEKFGLDAHFFSCSIENMTIPDAIQFMKERRKIVEISPDYYSADPKNKCHH